MGKKEKKRIDVFMDPRIEADTYAKRKKENVVVFDMSSINVAEVWAVTNKH